MFGSRKYQRAITEAAMVATVTQQPNTNINFYSETTIYWDSLDDIKDNISYE